MSAILAATGSENDLVFFLNGEKIVVSAPDPEDTLLQYLRETKRLTGTKLGCAEGGCGACTVMVSKYERNENKIKHYSVNACLAPLVSMHGQAVITVEGIGSTKTRLHAVQERLANSHGSQCGFCTPGIVMSMYTLLRNNPKPTQEEMEKAFEGNLCRCTGYRPILEGFKSFTTAANQCPMGEKCCKNKGEGSCGGQSQNASEGEEYHTNYDATQEPIFPAELMLADYDQQVKKFKGERVEWRRPTDLNGLLELKKQFPTAKLVCGNTEIGVEIKFKNQHYPVIIAPTHIKELTEVHIGDAGIWFGASVTLSQLDQVLHKQIQTLPEYQTRVYAEIVEMLKWFAGHQIRNISSMAGNLMTASPISDLNPLYLAAGVKIRVSSKDRGQREITLDEKFFISYRRIAVESDEVLTAIFLPLTTEREFFSGYKQAHRKEDDIAIVNAGMRVKFDRNWKVENVSLAFGGMAPVTKVCTKTSGALRGMSWDDKLLEEGIRLLKEDLPLIDAAPGGMIAYRKTLTISFFYKFYLTVKMRLASLQGDDINGLSREKSATGLLTRQPTRGIQLYEDNTSDSQNGDCFKPIPHKAAVLQCTGEAQYVDDLPKYRDELYMALVTSNIAHGNIILIDPSDALSCPGVKDFISAVDIPGSNVYRFTGDEYVFADSEVTCVGQVVGAVIADTQRHAQLAAKRVKIQYEELPHLLTIEDAVEAQSFFVMNPKPLWKGDVESGMSAADHVFTGEMRVGGQEHFYLETQASLCVPKENGEMELYSSTQNPSEIQMFVSSVLNVPSNRINVRVKRMGGGFGGKETRASTVALPAAVAAFKHGVPVRCMLDRDEDMVITGTRHPFLAKYKVGVNSDGKIVAVDVLLYSNGGNSTDLSLAVMERALYSIDNAYCIPNFRVKGFVCKTNTPSNTAFRGFGGPQGMMIMEHIMTRIAAKLNIPEIKLKEMNMYQEGDVTHFGQPLKNCNMKKCWSQVLGNSNFEERQRAVTEYNKEHRWRKRGISAIPTKFGISFTHFPLNQSGALVHVYLDGNVLLSHGGTEMGQGLYTKMIQVASTAFGIPSDYIYTQETSTTTVPNTSPTAASASSDLNGGAILDACLEINKRLKPIKDANPDGKWEDWIRTAYFSRVSLSAVGYYRTPDLHMDWEKSSGEPFAYFTFGASVSEVEIDCLTGDHQVLRTDIVMDLGKSLNPAIDVGQIEGGFVQGYGLFCLEQIKLMADKGHLLTRGPGAYKIPGFGNVPQEFNVTLLKDAPNMKAVYSSKAVGEPPLFLSASVFFAIKSAIAAARVEAGKSADFTLFAPCTPERIRMSCADHLSQQFDSRDDPVLPQKSFFIEP